MKAGRNESKHNRSGVDGPAASELAMLALAYLAQDEDRVARFLALTGLDAGDVRALVADRGFQLAVLDHLAGDETMLMDFAAGMSVPPDAVGRARRALGGGDV